MTTTDWIVDIALILIVLRQIRESRLTWHVLLLPVVLISWSVASYLHSIPTAGHDLELVGVAVAVGGTLGAASGLATRVRGLAGEVLVKAGPLAALLWVLGAGTRLAFQLYATHGGQAHIASFSIAHRITTEQAWVAALILMALAEVMTRMSILFWRGRLVRRQLDGARGAGRATEQASGRRVVAA